MSTPISPLTTQQTAAQETKAASENYVQHDLVGFDQFVNVLMDGDPDETISSRMARWSTEDSGLKKDIGTAVSKGLDAIQPDHGAKAEAGDEERAETVAKLEDASGDIGK